MARKRERSKKRALVDLPKMVKLSEFQLPSAKDRKRFAKSARDLLAKVKARDKVRRHSKEETYRRRRRGMLTITKPTDDYVAKMIVWMLKSCEEERSPPSTELIQLVSYQLLGLDVHLVETPSDFLWPPGTKPPWMNPRFQYVKFLAALEYQERNPRASARVVASVVKVDHKTILKWRVMRQWRIRLKKWGL